MGGLGPMDNEAVEMMVEAIREALELHARTPDAEKTEGIADGYELRVRQVDKWLRIDVRSVQRTDLKVTTSTEPEEDA